MVNMSEYTDDLTPAEMAQFDQSMVAFGGAWASISAQTDAVFHSQGRVAAFRFAMTAMNSYMKELDPSETPKVKQEKVICLMAAGFLATMDLAHDVGYIEKIALDFGLVIPKNELEDLL